jgi:catechol 2,3-dioxygenase-like lactoylglutathione lyase family enzyme
LASSLAITRLNHAVLYVRDAERSAGFYADVLGFRRLPVEFPGAVFMQAAGSTVETPTASSSRCRGWCPPS